MKPGIPNSQRLLQELIAERERITGEKSREIYQAYLRWARSADGKIILADLEASYAGISFVPGYPDVMTFKEGRRSVFDDLKNTIALAVAMELSE